MLNKKLLITVGLIPLLLTGCASIVGGGSVKQVKIDSTPSEANVLVEKVLQKDDEAKTIEYIKIIEGTTPIITAFDRCGTYRVSLEKDSIKKQEIIRNQFNPMMIGNLLFGGVVGIVVDAATGARCKHQDEYIIDLNSSKPLMEAEKEKQPIEDNLRR